ncbi:MAG: hypothetical protein WCK90_00250 [archaeon]
MGMEKSLKLGNELVEQVWQKMNPNELPRLRQGPRERVVVIDGSYDHIEKILDEAKVPYTKLNKFPNKEDLSQGGRYFNSKVIFANCDASYHQGLGAKNVTSENRSALRHFIENGGRMVTTDWAQTVVRYLFGAIQAKEGVTADEVVKVKFTSSLAAKISGITYGNAKPNWWLESSSDIIRFDKESPIISLVESEELEKKYGSKYIAVGLPHENGEVFHFVSHLIAQRLKNYSKGDRECLRTFLDLTGTSMKDCDGSKLTFGEIETTYTLMYTVLELCRDGNILKKLKGGVS